MVIGSRGRKETLSLEVDGVKREVPAGIRLVDLLPREKDGHPVVAGLLGRKPVSLLTQLASDCVIRSLSTGELEGQRIYQQSLTLLLLEAGAGVAPGLELRVRDSLGGAMRIEVRKAGSVPAHGNGKNGNGSNGNGSNGNGSHAPIPMEPLALALEAEMRRLIALDLPLRQELCTVEEALAHYQAEGWRDVVDFLQTWRRASVPLASYGQVGVLQTGPLLHGTGQLSALRLFPAGDELILVDQPHKLSRIEQMVRRASQGITPHEKWLGALGISNVGAFNRACIDGDVAQLIRVSEGFHEKSVSRIADEIAARAGERDGEGVGAQARARLVCIAGPSSSGKTTFIKRLMVQLQVEGIQPIGLSMDDYYLDRERSPRDEKGDYDFEALEALDLPLLRRDLAGLMRGDCVKTAKFDFKAGRSLPGGGPELTVGPNEVLLLEGIHGLNPRIFEEEKAGEIYRVFVCPRAQLAFDRMTRIHASDVRLLRRIVRDRYHRGHSAADTILRWPSVRDGEQRHIFPFEHNADATFDSSLIYELSVLKVYAERYLLEVPHDHPAYTVAFRLLTLLESVVSIHPEHVPPTSFLREFIGGSGFDY
jgi:uridine kinase